MEMHRIGGDVANGATFSILFEHFVFTHLPLAKVRKPKVYCAAFAVELFSGQFAVFNLF